MKNLRLNGWVRLGVLISIGWIIFSTWHIWRAYKINYWVMGGFRSGDCIVEIPKIPFFIYYDKLLNKKIEKCTSVQFESALSRDVTSAESHSQHSSLTPLQQFKQQHPQYRNMPDGELARKIYDKSYADKMTWYQFTKMAGYKPPAQLLVRKPLYISIVGFYLFPILAFWLSAYTIFYAIRWVDLGFKNR